MSRPQGHRKSQSTSALNVIADSTSSLHQSTATPRSRRTQGSSTRLGSVVEDDSEREERSQTHSHSHSHSISHLNENNKDGLEGLLGMISSRTPRKERHHERERGRNSDTLGEEDLRAAISDIRSLRSSERRRLAALRNIERIFVSTCAGLSSITISTLIAAELHTALISLFTRHAQTLSHRAAKSYTTLSSSDSVANALREEMGAIFAILQGLCLVDRKAKSEMGESWMLETIIDLLLVLRAQGAPEGEKPVAYLMLDLLCCILVDSPTHSRTFEHLNGLEAVVRVLKGTGVAKEVRMKCIEFLYFYLLPEQSLPPQRNTSASSTSTSSSAESQLYPPTPVSEDLEALECPSTPSRRNRTPTSDKKPYSDLDITFVPQTPRRPHEPSLGYLTPSTRRVSGSSNTSLSVPPSPSGPSRSPSHRRLMSVTDTSDSDNSGLGLGLSRSDTARQISRDIPAIRLPEDELSNPFSTTTSHTTSTSSGSSTVMPGSRAISRSSTHTAMSSVTGATSGGMSRTSSMRRISNPPSSREVSADESSTATKDRAPRARHSTSAQVVASASAHRGEPPRPSARVPHSRSSIQLSDGTSPTEERRPSQHRVSRSGTSAQLSDMINSSADETNQARPIRRASVHPSSSATPQSAHRPISRSSTSGQLGNLATESVADQSRPPKPRQSLSHARTPSLLSGARGLSVDTSMPPPPSPNTSMPPPPSPNTSMAPPPSPNTSMPPPPSPNTSSMPPPPLPKPTPRKGFPAGITKGLPSAVSSPNFNSMSPLTASRRIPSGKLAEKRSSSKLKEVKSVEEKKELLGQWLGNVDALVQGVEKVSFWSSVSKR